MDKPIGRLILRSLDANSINANQTDMTWNNINLKRVLSDLYDKYDKFNLSLVSVSSDQANAALGTTISDCVVNTFISGLPFLNSMYLSSTGNNTSQSYLTTINFVRSNNTFQNYSNGCVLTFLKPTSAFNDIRIVYQGVNSNTYPATNNAYPNVNFVFQIYGIEQSGLKGTIPLEK